MSLSQLTDELRNKAAAPPAEPPTPPAEPPTPPAEPPTPPAEPPAPPAPPDRLGILGEAFGRTFASDDEFTQFKADIDAHPEREAAWLREREELEAGLDESKLYPNEQFRVAAKLLMMFPDKNPIAMSEMLTMDGSKAYINDPVNVLALSLMLDNPEIYPDKATAMEVIADKHNLTRNDDGTWDMSETVKRSIQTEAKAAVGKFNELKEKVPAPAKVDLAGKRAEKQQAEQARQNKVTEDSKTFFTKTLPASLKAIEIPVTVQGEDGKETTETVFSYTIPESYAKSKSVQDVIEAVRQDKVRNAAAWTPELEAQTLKETSELLSAMYFYRNRTDIYKALATELNTKFTDEAWAKKHKVRPLRVEGTVHTPTAEEQQEKANLSEAAKRIGITLPT